MKIRLAMVMVAALAALVLPSFAAPEEYRVRAVSFLQGNQSPEIHVHDPAGTATAGRVRVKSFLNHEYDLLDTKGGAVVLTGKADPASAKIPEEVIAQLELPGKPGAYILLLLPGEKGSPRAKAVVVDSSAKAFPPGSVMVMNQASAPVTIELEKKPFEFKAGETRIIKDLPVGENNSAGMKASWERGGKREAIASGIWTDPGEKRSLKIVLQNPGSGRAELKGLRDVAKP